METKSKKFIFSFKFLLLVIWYLIVLLLIYYRWGYSRILLTNVTNIFPYLLYFLIPFLFFRNIGEKFILSTKSLFSISFFLFFIQSIDYLMNMRSFDKTFWLSVVFYFLMPFIRFIVNYKKIDTEHERKLVSGFWSRFFSGMFVSLLTSLIAVILLIFNPFELIIYVLYIFYIFAILTLSNNKEVKTG